MKMNSEKKNEKGAVMLIEAAFVLPITFFVVFVMIMAGEAYYQHARVEYLVTQAVISGAARCENPMLEYVMDKGAVPKETKDVKILPYRYIFTGEAKAINDEVNGKLEDDIKAMKPLFWSGMSPKLSSGGVNGKMKVNPLISSYQVQCDFDIELPIRMIFTGNQFKFHYSVSMVETIGDPSELVRNCAMINDLIDRFEQASAVRDKINELASKVGDYVN